MELTSGEEEEEQEVKWEERVLYMKAVWRHIRVQRYTVGEPGLNVFHFLFLYFNMYISCTNHQSQVFIYVAYTHTHMHTCRDLTS